MSKSVWAIEDGEYSSYHVVGVFTSRENAELILSKLKSGEIVEWPLDPAVEKVNAGLSCYYVQMLRDGTVCDCCIQEFRVEEFDIIHSYGGCDSAIAGLRMWVFAKDKGHAIKIATEKRLQDIACGKWDAP